MFCQCFRTRWHQPLCHDQSRRAMPYAILQSTAFGLQSQWDRNRRRENDENAPQENCPNPHLVDFWSRDISPPRTAFFATSDIRLILVPPPPFEMQNPENKRFILPLCARSLSSKDLYAKSREHGSYGGRDSHLASHFGPGAGSAFGTGSEATHRPGQIVKDRRLSSR